MYSSLSSIHHARRSSSLISFLAHDHGDLTAASRSFSSFPVTYGPQLISQDGSKSLANIVRRNISHHVGGLSARSLALSSGIMHFRGNATAPYALRFLSSIGSNAQNDFLSGFRNPMNFVRDIIEVEDRNTTGHPGYTTGKSADFVHIKLMRNNSFVTVTGSKGNKMFGASLGSVPGLKGSKTTRYSGEAVAEHVGRMSRNLGLKAVVVKVKGFTFFKKKKQAILSWREGYTNSWTDQNPIVYIEDTTRNPHNGCRLPKRRCS